MLEIALILFILLTHKKSKGGFTQTEESTFREVFFVNECEDISIYLNGYPSGIKGSGSVFIAPQHKATLVEYFLRGQKVGEDSVYLTAPKLYLVGPGFSQLPKMSPVYSVL